MKATNNYNLIKNVMDNLQERYVDLEKVKDTELLKDVYETIPFSFSSELCTLLSDKNDRYIEGVIDGICLDGMDYKFNEQHMYMEYIKELTNNIIELVKNK